MAGSRSTASELAPAAEPRRAGSAHHGGRTIPLAVTAASRLSLRVELAGGARVENGALFDAIELEVDGRQVRLGRCRFDAEGGAAHGACGRVVFLDEVYDCRALVVDGNFVSLRGTFHNLAVVLAQREQIRPEFKEFCADVLYDMSVYRRYFDEQDALLENEPEDVAEVARDAIIASNGRRFIEFLRQTERELEDVVRSYTKAEHDRHGFFLRRVAWPHIVASEVHRRTNLKPRGYSGDAQTMQLIYENGYAGKTLFGKLLHKYAVEMPGAEAVRARRGLVTSLMRETVARLGPGVRPFRFLSLASGGAQELRDIYQSPEDARDIECTLVDQDPMALDVARRTIAEIQKERGSAIRAVFVTDSVRMMLRERHLSDRLGRFHYVYSMGLFDYLTGPVASAVLARMYELLVPGGTLTIGNFHTSHASRTYMAYWLDWPLFLRDEAALLGLADGLAGAAVGLTFDSTGCQMFMRIDKRA